MTPCTPEGQTRDALVKGILAHHTLKRDQILSPSRARDIVCARHEISYWLRMRTSLSLTSIAKVVGLTSHKSVLYAIHKHANIHSLPVPSHGELPKDTPSITRTIVNAKPRVGMTPWNDDETAKLKEMVGNHMSDIEIADELGRSIMSVQGKVAMLRRDDKVRQRPSGGRGTFWTPERKTAMLEMYEAGYSMKDIANEVGSTYSAVNNKLYDMGAKSDRKGDPIGRPRAAKQDYAPKEWMDRGIHPMWGMDEDDRRRAFWEKFNKGWREVQKRLAA